MALSPAGLPKVPNAMLYICCCCWPTLPGPIISVDCDAIWFIRIWLENWLPPVIALVAMSPRLPMADWVVLAGLPVAPLPPPGPVA